MNTINVRKYLLIISLNLALGNLAAQSLDDLLGIGVSDLAQSTPETMAMWNDLVTALERGDTNNATKLAETFNNVIDFTEPYQRNFAAAAFKILTAEINVGADGKPAISQDVLDKIADVLAQISANEREIGSLNDTKAELTQRLNRSSTRGAVIGGLLGSDYGNIASADREALARDIQGIDEQIRVKQAIITEFKNKIPFLEAEGRESLTEDRNKAFVLLRELMEDGYFREAIALASTYLRRFGQDTDFVRLSQSAVNQQRTQVQALAIAKAATKDAVVLMERNLLWDAKVEMERSVASIRERVNDAELLRFTEVEMGKISRDLTRKIENALKSRDTIMQMAMRDALAAGKRYAEFIKNFADFPEAESDNLKLSDLKTAQIEAKFAQRIAAIEEVINNDPAEAKEMIKRLIADNSDPDEVSVIRSRMRRFERALLQQEIGAIQKRLDEAQSFLTKWNVTFAEAIGKGVETTASFTASLSGGTENLTRAISIQEGVVKQIDILLQESMDSVSKSQVVALQETARAALKSMNSANEQAAIAEKKKSERERVIIFVVVGLAAVLIGGGVVFMMKRKRVTLTQ